MQRLKWLAALVLILTAGSVSAQSTIDSDSLLQQAQVAARQGNYSTSRKLARQVLRVAPAYTDAAILIGNTYTWEQKYDSANFVLQPLLSASTPTADLYLALIRLGLRSKTSPELILHYADQGLVIAPQSQELLEYKIQALIQQKKYLEAEKVLESLPQQNSFYQRTKTQLHDLASINSLHTEYQYATFSTAIPSWHLASLEYTRLLAPGSIGARVNYANRFEQQALQGEVDFWPRLDEKTYLYLNAGFSDSKLFPDYRAGLEAYRKLPHNLEASLGVRALIYSQETVWLYTGHIGKYWGKYWAGMRPFIQPQQGQVQATGILQLRRFLKDENQHLTLTLSKGSTPDMQVGLQEINRQDANKIGIRSQFRLGASFFWGAVLQFEYEEVSKESSRNRYTTGLSLQYKFR
ncbi:YaiO family outer membrane beta-barrel protein [Pontibacter sp. JH31]|uniref:YaiO family outer membrane beta-barrel protein n=1 Tax=Pontibacter aquaedesilientis TaxID=2766980 RepID=A0ABR7XBE0_9BACT|nr:YaiO family outer membrane beta-barrel protein [Pontibacter aquaedesilientis]MBD1395635.1 YaiO family outer membrane beta-barrel protein [Pontibacter aquaedesilientis]